MVGNVSTVYSGGKLTITYTVSDGFFLTEIHIHVDGPDNEKKVPLIDGKYTVAPGQYGCGTHRTNEDSCIVQQNTNSVFEASFEGVSNPFYVIAHAVVAGSDDAFSATKGLGEVCP